MVHKIMKLAKGMRFIRPSTALVGTLKKEFDFPIKIHNVVQNVYTGAEVVLLSDKDKNNFWIRYSSGDTSFFKEGRLAKDYFMGLVSKEGELI